MKRVILSLILGLFFVAASDVPAMAYAGHVKHHVASSHVVKASATKKAKHTKKHVKKHAKKEKAATSIESAPVEATPAAE
jgi:hypothetical protein